MRVKDIGEQTVYNGVYFGGYQVIESSYMSDTVQVKTHKKKRINKKWKKKYGTKEAPWNQFVITNDGKIISHPEMIGALRNTIEFERF